MSSTSNYNAITNLVETIIDYLVVDTAEINTATIQNLTSNVGTITTLNSTTATLTSANIPTLTTTTAGITTANITTENTTTSNITTANITSLNANSIQANPVSSSVSLYTTGTGALTLGNTSNTNGLTINNKILMGTGKQIEITPTGYLVVETIRGYAFANAVSLYLNQTGTISFGNNLGTGGGITFNDNTTIGTGKKITTPDILVSSLTGSKIVLSDASKNLISSAYDTTTLPISTPTQTALDLKSNIANPTFTTGITTPLITFNGVQIASKLLLTNASKVVISSSYTDTDMAILSLSNTFSGTSNTFSNTILVNTITGTTTGSAISLFGTSTSLIDLGNSSSTSVIRLNQNTSVANTKIFRTPYLYPTSTIADLYVGNQATDSGILYIELNADLHSSRKLKLNNTTASKLLLTNTNKEIISSAYDELSLPISTLTQSALNLKANINAPVFTTSVGLTSGDITISSGKLVNNTFQGTTAGGLINLFSLTTGSISIGGVSSSIALQDNVVTAIGKTLTMTTSGSIINDIYRGISVGNAISLFSTTTAGITLGGASSGISLADNTTLPTGKTLTLSTTGSILCPTYSSTSATQALLIGNTNTTANITIGGAQSSGNLTIGGGADTGSTLTCYKNIQVDSNRNISLSTNGIISCDFINALSATSTLALGQTATSGNITLGGFQTTGEVRLSNTSATGKVVARNKMEFRTATESCYINTSTGVNLFTSTYLAGKPLSSNIYAGAPTDQWNVWDSNCENSLQDGSAICQNGNTTIIVNPGDQSTLWWIDEDIMTTATNYAITTGWKMSTTGAITNLSDRRVKRNIKPVIDDHILDKLLELELVKFQYKPPTPEKEYKNGKLRTKYTEYHSGYVAQNVNNVFPDACERVNADAYWMLKKDVVNDYYNLGVQELIKENKQRTQENKDMKVIIDDLTARLIRLEQILLNP